MGLKNGSHFTHILTLARMAYIAHKHDCVRLFAQFLHLHAIKRFPESSPIGGLPFLFFIHSTCSVTTKRYLAASRPCIPVFL